MYAEPQNTKFEGGLSFVGRAWFRHAQPTKPTQTPIAFWQCRL
jgi:hypothetical protein